jgi:hypothetical protein
VSFRSFFEFLEKPIKTNKQTNQIPNLRHVHVSDFYNRDRLVNCVADLDAALRKKLFYLTNTPHDPEYNVAPLIEFLSNLHKLSLPGWPSQSPAQVSLGARELTLRLVLWAGEHFCLPKRKAWRPQMIDLLNSLAVGVEGEMDDVAWRAQAINPEDVDTIVATNGF